jgi:hypothetical protein
MPSVCSYVWKCTESCLVQIMESLGGDNAWVDRFVAQHASLAYYWGVVLLYMLSPKHAYEFSELVEGHAVDTYEGACFSVCVAFACACSL